MRRTLILVALTIALLPNGAAGKAFKKEFKSRFVEFEYGWSTEANAIPTLAARFAKDMRKQRASISAAARRDAAERKNQGFPFNPYVQTTNITTAAQSSRLLSLRIDSYEFSGGAHGNSGSRALLWDRRLNKEIKFESVFRPGSSFLAAIRIPYCRALGNERSKRRQDRKLGGDFDQCPPFSDLALIPVDGNRNGRIDHLLIVASPYMAGPYVEGEYEIKLPLTSALIVRMKPEFRSSFGS